MSAVVFFVCHKHTETEWATVIFGFPERNEKKKKFCEDEEWPPKPAWKNTSRINSQLNYTVPVFVASARFFIEEKDVTLAVMLNWGKKNKHCSSSCSFWI